MAFFLPRRLNVPIRLLLLSNALFATGVLAAAAMVALKLPLDKVFWFPVGATVVLFGLLLGRVRKLYLVRRVLPFLAVMALAISLVIGRPVLKHRFLSTHPDAWSYCAFSEYVTHHSRAVDFGLPPIEQYACHLKDTRFGTSALLGLIEVLTQRNAATALAPFVILVLANVFAGFAILCRVNRCSGIVSLAAGLFATACSWVPDAVRVGNFDNLLFLAILPHFLARFSLFSGPQKTTRSVLGLVVTTAALFYVYPEGLVITMVLFSPFFFRRTFCDLAKHRSIRAYISFGICVLIIILPYIGVFVAFANSQLHAAETTHPGANLFAGLLSPALLPAIFGLGTEFRATMVSLWNDFLPLTLILLISLALASWWRRNRSLFFSFCCFILFAIWQGGFERYDYGLYKVLFIGSVLWVPAIFYGLQLILRRFERYGWRNLRIPVIVALLVLTFAAKANSWLPINQSIPMKPYEQLSQVQSLLRNHAVLLDCQTDFDQEWAIFFLRDTPLKLRAQRGYMAAQHVLPFMARAKYAEGEPSFVLADRKISGAIWRNGKFSLVARENYLAYQITSGPNSAEEVNGKPFVWIANEPTHFVVDSPRRQNIRFSAEEGWLGGSLPEVDTRVITVDVGEFRRTIITRGTFSLDIPIECGQNIVRIWCEDKPTVSVTPNGDRRVLLFGLLDFRFEPLQVAD